MNKILVSISTLMLLFTACASPNSAETVLTEPEQTLVTFFDYLVEENYASATGLFTTDEFAWASVYVYSRPEEDDPAQVFDDYCTTTGTCLKVKILKTIEISPDEFKMKVQFLNADGSIFVFGPCCGATEEEMPPEDEFDFTVKKEDGEFKVMTPPLYIP